MGGGSFERVQAPVGRFRRALIGQASPNHAIIGVCSLNAQYVP